MGVVETIAGVKAKIVGGSVEGKFEKVAWLSHRGLSAGTVAVGRGLVPPRNCKLVVGWHSLLGWHVAWTLRVSLVAGLSPALTRPSGLRCS